MKNNNRKLVICGLFLGIILSVCDKNTLGPDGFDSSDTEQLQAALEEGVQAYKAAGAVAAVRGPDGSVWTGVAGVSPDSEPVVTAGGDSVYWKGSPITKNMKFRIGSITKTFTAVLIMILANKGELTLEDTIDQWFPDLVENSDIITIRQMLAMTSGLRDYEPVVTALAPEDPNRHWAPAEIVDLFKAWPPEFPPGTDWEYSNTGYVILARIAEVAMGGTSYEELVRNLILEPLDLENTFVPVSGNMPEPHARAFNYLTQPVPGWTEVTDWDPSYAWSAGHMISTAEDLLVFLGSIFDGTLMGTQYRDAMLDTKPTGADDVRYGFAIVEARGMIGHSGYIYGYNSAMYRFGEYDIVVVTSCLGVGIAEGIYQKLMNVLSNLEP